MARAVGVRLWLCLLLAGPLGYPRVCRADCPVVLINRTAAQVRVTYVSVPLRDPRVRVRVEVCAGFPGGDERFRQMVQRLTPVAAIGGAYYSKVTKLPIGDIVVDGRLRHRGMMGTALAITRGGIPTMRRVPWGHAVDWRGYQTVLACGPALVLNGQVDVDPEAEGFQDPHIMAMVPRLAVGYTADHHLLLAYIREGVSFAREALVMKTLGCVGAMNLDAGPGLALFYRGRILARPRRPMTNILCVYERKGQENASRPAPGPLGGDAGRLQPRAETR